MTTALTSSLTATAPTNSIAGPMTTGAVANDQNQVSFTQVLSGQTSAGAASDANTSTVTGPTPPTPQSESGASTSSGQTRGLGAGAHGGAANPQDVATPSATGANQNASAPGPGSGALVATPAAGADGGVKAPISSAPASGRSSRGLRDAKVASAKSSETGTKKKTAHVNAGTRSQASSDAGAVGVAAIVTPLPVAPAHLVTSGAKGTGHLDSTRMEYAATLT
ncbi:MAG: hypothetical protein ACYC1I_09345, partial [Acidimicrobiales bacterium]